MTASLSLTYTNPTPAPEESFGNAVAAVGTDKILIGAWKDNTGSAYLYSTSGVLMTTFTNPAVDGNYCRYAVAAVGIDKVLIGDLSGNTGITGAGAAHLFSTNGALLTTFTNSIPLAGSYFGNAVTALGEDKVLIGAFWESNQRGAAYLFSTNGRFLRKYTNSSQANGDHFGTAVAAVGTDRVLIGAPQEALALLA